MTSPISKQRLHEFLFDCGFANVRAPGGFYALPSVEWIQDTFSPAFRDELRARGMDRFVRAKNVCVHFSRYAAVFAGECHLKTDNEATNLSSLAFGTFDFVQPDGGEHSINIIVSRYPDLNLWLVFYEPQTQQIVPQPNRKENTECNVSF